MDMQSPSTDTPVMAAPPSSAGLLGTKIPSTVVFVLGILLFFMPFAELKCKQNTQAETSGLNFNLGGETTISNTGFGLAIGKQWKAEINGMGGFVNSNSSMNKDQPKQDPNSYAIAAMLFGIIGLLLCFAKFKGAAGIAMLAGILSAFALIGLRFDLDKKVKDPSQVVQKTDHNSDWLGNGLDTVKFELNFTPWFYLAVIAMIVAAVLCYLRIKNTRTV
jgi:hypothetical protein